jgi:hypothetical protein
MRTPAALFILSPLCCLIPAAPRSSGHADATGPIRADGRRGACGHAHGHVGPCHADRSALPHARDRQTPGRRSEPTVGGDRGVSVGRGCRCRRVERRICHDITGVGVKLAVQLDPVRRELTNVVRLRLDLAPAARSTLSVVVGDHRADLQSGAGRRAGRGQPEGPR